MHRRCRRRPSQAAEQRCRGPGCSKTTTPTLTLTPALTPFFRRPERSLVTTARSCTRASRVLLFVAHRPLISEEISALDTRIRLRHAPAVSSSLVSLAWPRVAAETAAVPLNRAAEASLIHRRIIRLMRYSTPALRLNSGPSTFATHRLVGDRCGFARAGRGFDCCKSCMHARVRRLALISPTFLARSSHTHTNRFLGRKEDNDTFAFEIIRVRRRPCRRLLRRPRHRRRQQCRSSRW